MIVFRNATKQFSNESYGIKDVSFEVPVGGFLFVTGKSGSGKTTLMKLLTREYSLTAGEITVDDVQLSQLKKSKVYQHRRNIGIVYQDYLLLPDLNVWENIALPLSVHGRSSDDIESRVTDLLKLVKLTDKAFSFPSELSGGEAQRISIARALATGPKIIFADEPTGNLDAENTRHIAALLKKIHELGTTVICATHDPTLLELITRADHVVLENGVVKDKSVAKSTEHKKSKVETKNEKPEKKAIAKEDKKQEAEDPDLEITVETLVVEDIESSDSEPDDATNSQSAEKEATNTDKPKETAAAEKTSWWSKLFGKKKATAAKQPDTSKKSTKSEEPKSESKKSEPKKSEHKKSETTEDKKTSDHKKHESKEDKVSKDSDSDKEAKKSDQADKSDTKDTKSKKK